MKKILFTILIIASFTNSFAQIPLSTFTALRTQINTQFTAATGFHSITHVVEGNMLDTMTGLMSRLNNLISGSSGLQGTLNAGNTATSAGGNIGQITLSDATGYQQSYFNSVAFNITSASQTLAALSNSGGDGALILAKGSSTYSGQIRSDNLTANRICNLPDEGTGHSPNDDIVLHLTKYQITVSNGTGECRMEPNGSVYSFAATGDNFVKMQASSSAGASGLQIAWNDNVGSLFADNISANIDLQIPDENGSNAPTAPTIVTHVTKSATLVGAGTLVTPTAGVYSDPLGSSTYYLSGTNWGGIGAGPSGLYLQMKSSFTGNKLATISPGNLTANRAFTMPDKSGEVAVKKEYTYQLRSIDGTATGITTIATTDAGTSGRFIVLGYLINVTAITPTGPVTGPTYNIGWTSGSSYNDIASAAVGANAVDAPNFISSAIITPASSVLKIDITSAATGASAYTFDIYVRGFYEAL